jgi:hypothetical protein
MRLPLPLSGKGFGLVLSQQSTVKRDPEWIPWKEFHSHGGNSASAPNLPLGTLPLRRRCVLLLPAWLQEEEKPTINCRRAGMEPEWKNSIPMEGIPLPRLEDAGAAGRCRGDASTRGFFRVDHDTEAYGGLQAGRKATGGLQPP